MLSKKERGGAILAKNGYPPPNIVSLIKHIKILIYNFIVCYTASLNTVTALLE